MGLDGVIRRRDRRPLGSVEDVQHKLEAVFPGAKFAIQHEPPDLRPIPGKTHVEVLLLRRPGLLAKIVYLVNRLFRVGELEYPYTEGSFEGDGIAISFFLGSAPIVQAVDITLYGGGDAEPYIAELASQYGWEV